MFKCVIDDFQRNWISKVSMDAVSGCRCIKGTTECLDFMLLMLNKLNFAVDPIYYYIIFIFIFIIFIPFLLGSVTYYSQQLYHAVELILKWIYIKKLIIWNPSSNQSPSEVLMLLIQGLAEGRNGQNLLNRWRCWNVRNIQLQIAQQGCDTPSWNLGTRWDLIPLQAD